MTCEKCWSDARSFAKAGGIIERIGMHYDLFIDQRRASPCTPREQAGQYWNEAEQRDVRLDWPAKLRGLRGH